MVNIVLLGASGSGKGTQAKLLVERFGMIYINTGDLLRQEKNSGSELGLKIASYIDDGNLVPDEVSTDIIKNKIKEILDGQKPINGFIFDGYPRTNNQAINLDNILSDFDLSIDLVFHIQIPNEIIFERIKERVFIEKRIDDQFDEKINKRLTHYNKNKSSIVEYYMDSDKIYNLDGNKSITKLFYNISEYVLNKISLINEEY